MPVLVAYNFKSDLVRLKQNFPKGRALDVSPQTIVDWNAGKIPVLFAHPASAGHGLNLQDGGNILVFFGHDWNLENRLQIIERIGPHPPDASRPRSTDVHPQHYCPGHRRRDGDGPGGNEARSAGHPARGDEIERLPMTCGRPTSSSKIEAPSSEQRFWALAAGVERRDLAVPACSQRWGNCSTADLCAGGISVRVPGTTGRYKHRPCADCTASGYPRCIADKERTPIALEIAPQPRYIRSTLTPRQGIQLPRSRSAPAGARPALPHRARPRLQRLQASSFPRLQLSPLKYRMTLDPRLFRYCINTTMQKDKIC
jgi:hypothetical protein